MKDLQISSDGSHCAFIVFIIRWMKVIIIIAPTFDVKDVVLLFFFRIIVFVFSLSLSRFERFFIFIFNFLIFIFILAVMWRKTK